MLNRTTMGIDYYAETESIAQALETQGLVAEAKSLRDAIECGSTATEILMALRWHLSKFEETKISGDAFTNRRMLRLLAELNRELS